MDRDKEGKTLILGPECNPCRYLVPVKDPPGPGILSKVLSWLRTRTSNAGFSEWRRWADLERLVWVRHGGVGTWPWGTGVQKYGVRLGLEGTQTAGLMQMVYPDQE